MKQYEIIIMVDINDGDDLYGVEFISEETLEKIRPVCEAISNFQPYEVNGLTFYNNWPYSEYAPRTDLGEKTVMEIYEGQFSQEAYNAFIDLCPWGEYGFHTVESVEVSPIVAERERLV